MKVSACIMTRNEAYHIQGLLDCIAGMVDEIVIVDGMSTDGTPDVCREYTSSIYQRVPCGWPEPDRDFCIRQARNDWVLFLDADERPSFPLLRDIDMLTNDGAVAYWIPRRNYYARDRYYHHIFYPDYQLRLFDRRYTTWPTSVHSSAKVDGTPRYLLEPYYLKHLDPIYSDRDKYERYARIHAAKWPVSHSPVVYHMAAPFRYLSTLYADLVKGCWLDGAAGLLAACRHAQYNYRVYNLIGRTQL